MPFTRAVESALFWVSANMLWVWLFVASFGAVFLQVVSGCHGLQLPLFAVTSFYFTVALGWRRPLPAIVIMGTMLDLLLARTAPVSLLLLPPIMMLALLWRRQCNCRAALAQAFPGFITGLVHGSGLLVLQCLATERWHIGLLWHCVRILAQEALGGALLLPLVCRVLDATADRLGLPLYRDIQDRLALGQRL